MRTLGAFKGTITVDREFYQVFSDCLSNDETRPFMHNVYYDEKNGCFASTDGRRLVTHFSEGYEEGFYELAKIGSKYKLIPVACKEVFPNYTMVLPDKDSYDVFEYNVINQFNKNEISSNILFSGNLDKDSPILCKIIIETGKSFNFNFLIKTLKNIPCTLYFTKEENKPLLFELDRDTRYVVMPMSI